MRISDWSSDVCSSDLWARVIRGMNSIATARIPFQIAAIFLDLVVGLCTAAPDIIMRGQSLRIGRRIGVIGAVEAIVVDRIARAAVEPMVDILAADRREQIVLAPALARVRQRHVEPDLQIVGRLPVDVDRSEEHTSELHSLMRISYAVFSLQ